MKREKADSEMALPFLFISFSNHQLPNHLTTVQAGGSLNLISHDYRDRPPLISGSIP